MSVIGKISRLARTLIVAGLAFAGSVQVSTAQTLTLGLYIAPTSLDPAKASIDNGFAMNVLGLSYEPLIRLDGAGKKIPGLAVEWGYSGENNTVFEMKLRSGAVFADGTPANADAVVNSIKYFMENGSYASYFEPVTSIEATDDTTVQITTDKVYPVWQDLFTNAMNLGFVISPAGLSNPEALQGVSFGSGPFVLNVGASTPGSLLVYDRNPNYYDQASLYYDTVKVMIIPNQQQLFNAVVSGLVDVAPGSAVGPAVEDAKLPHKTIFSSSYTWIIADRAGELVPALADPRVRQALNYAIPREAAVQAIWEGKWAKPIVTGPFSEAMFGYDPSLEEIYTYDPEKAKALLAEAGYPDGFDIGKILALNPVVRAEVLASAWNAIGVKTEVEAYDGWSTLIPVIMQKKNAVAYGTSPTQPTYFLAKQWLLPGENNRFNSFGTDDPEITSLVMAAEAASPGSPEQAELYQSAFRRAIEQGWWASLARGALVWYMNPKVVTGLEKSTDPAMNFDILLAEPVAAK